MKYIWSGEIHEEFIRAGFSTESGFKCLSKLIGTSDYYQLYFRLYSGDDNAESDLIGCRRDYNSIYETCWEPISDNRFIQMNCSTIYCLSDSILRECSHSQWVVYDVVSY